MRTIKFRGVDTMSGDMVYGDLVQQELADRNIKTAILQTYATYDVKPETVGQYTGLHDCNGKEIYEGDIIRFVDGLKMVNGEWVDNEFIYTIEYSEGAFSGVFGLSKVLDAVEVIGNIHDNPELMKGGEQ